MLRPPPPPRQSTLISNFQQNLANQNAGAPPPPPPKSSASSVISVSSSISNASNTSSSSTSSSNGNGSGSASGNASDEGRKTSNAAGGGGGGGGGPPRIPMSLPTSSSSSNLTSVPGPPPKPSGSPSSAPTSTSTSTSTSSSSIPRFGNQTLPQTAVRFGTVTFGGGAGAVTVPPPPAKLINSSSSASSLSTSSNITGTGPPPPPAKSNSTISSSPTLSSSAVTSPLSSPLSTPRSPNGSIERIVLPSLSSSSSSSTPSSSQPSTPTSVSFRSSLTPTNGTNLGNRPPPPPAKSSVSISTSTSAGTGKMSSSLLAQHNSMYGSSNNLYGMNKNSNNNNNDDNESVVSGISDSGDDKFSSYRPRITIYERQEFRQPQSSSRGVAAEAFTQCSAPMCFQMAEFEGLCINHYYSNNLSDSSSPSSTPTSTTSPSSSPFPSPSFPSRIGPPPAPTRSNSNSNSSGNKQVNEEERRKLAEEFLTTEKSYGQGLKSIVRGFILRLNKHAELDKPFLTQDEMSKIFLNIQDIFDLNRRMLKDLKRMKAEGTLVSQLGKTLLSYTPFLRIYIQYVSNYDDGNKLIVALRERKPELEFFFRLSELCEGQRLHDFLIQPVQRIPRYLLLLKGVQKNTDPSDPSYESIKQATIAVEKVATEINESFFWKEARQRVVDVQNHLEGCTIPLVTPTRFHVKDGGLRKKYNNTGFKINTFKKYWFFLFNDLLLYTTIPNAKGDCKLKYILPLLDMSITDLPDDPNAKFMWEIKGSVKSFVVAAGSLEEKTSWVTTLNKYIEMLKANNKTLKLAPNMNPLNEYAQQQENNVIEAMRDGGFL